jgi:hypothetical protein
MFVRASECRSVTLSTEPVVHLGCWWTLELRRTVEPDGVVVLAVFVKRVAGPDADVDAVPPPPSLYGDDTPQTLDTAWARFHVRLLGSAGVTSVQQRSYSGQSGDAKPFRLSAGQDKWG